MYRKLCITVILCLILYLSSSDGRQNRHDYKYYPEVDGWLKLHKVPAIWNEARLRCISEGANLASPTSVQMVKAVNDYIAQERHRNCAVFSGVHAIFSKGDYFSIEGVSLFKMPIKWAPGEPDNFENNESCLAFTFNGTMSDVKCGDPLPYVCHKKDTHKTISVCGTDDPGYQYETETRSCYKFHNFGQTWSRAYQMCAGEGAYLAIINSVDEANVLRKLYGKHSHNVHAYKKDIIAIGFHDWGERSTWRTIHGETLDEAGYNTWNGPDNATNARFGDVGEFCGSIYATGKLNDIWCNCVVPFICEKDPNSLYD